MKVFNLTDVETEVLKSRSLMNQHIAVAGRMIVPGEYVEVEDTPIVRSNILHLVQVGALSIDSLPPPYTQARKLVEAQSSAGRVSAHITLHETKTAGEPAPQPVATEPAVVLEKADLDAGPADEPPALKVEQKGQKKSR